MSWAYFHSVSFHFTLFEVSFDFSRLLNSSLHEINYFDYFELASKKYSYRKNNIFLNSLKQKRQITNTKNNPFFSEKSYEVIRHAHSKPAKKKQFLKRIMSYSFFSPINFHFYWAYFCTCASMHFFGGNFAYCPKRNHQLINVHSGMPFLHTHFMIKM